MFYLILIIVIFGLFILGYFYINYLKATRGTKGFAQRRAILLLFYGFISLIGITSVFADALFELLGLSKPLYFELISLCAYIVFAVATILIVGSLKRKASRFKQIITGTGDIVNGDKITYSSPEKKKDTDKYEVTREAHRKLTKFNDAMMELTIMFRNITGKPEDQIQQEQVDRLNNIGKLGEDFRQYFNANKIYFNKDLCAKISRIISIFKDCHFTYVFYHQMNFKGSSYSEERLESTRLKVREGGQTLIEEVEDEFREILNS